MKIAVTLKTGRCTSILDTRSVSRFMKRMPDRSYLRKLWDTNGSGHGALAGFLKEKGVDTLICGVSALAPQNALSDAGISLYGGVSGSADDAVKAFLDGSPAV